MKMEFGFIIKINRFIADYNNYNEIKKIHHPLDQIIKKNLLDIVRSIVGKENKKIDLKVFNSIFLCNVKTSMIDKLRYLRIGILLNYDHFFSLDLIYENFRRKLCVVVIPIHSESPSVFELISFQQCFKILSNHSIKGVKSRNILIPVLDVVFIDPVWQSSVEIQ
jgi:hypothetical protein